MQSIKVIDYKSWVVHIILSLYLWVNSHRWSTSELQLKRLELETQRMQDRMLKTLGPTNEVVKRREELILHLRKVDQKLADINTLIVNHVGESETATSDLYHTTTTSPALPDDSTNDKGIWLSGSSLDPHH